MGSSVEGQVLAVLVAEDLIEGTAPDLDDDLFEAGLSSLGAVRFLLAIEDALRVEIPDEALTWENLRTVRAVADLVSRADRP